MTSPADAHVHDTLAPHSHERERERETLDGALFGDDQPCFGCSPQHPVGFRLRFERLEGEAVSTCFTPTADHQGPPGIMHGGLVTTLADELAAWVIIAVLGKVARGSCETAGASFASRCRLRSVEKRPSAGSFPSRSSIAAGPSAFSVRRSPSTTPASHADAPRVARASPARSCGTSRDWTRSSGGRRVRG
jgi:acyl-coenzyme A thioesterase PaaI-like protein